MPGTFDRAFAAQLVSDLGNGHCEFGELPGWLFKDFVCYIDTTELDTRYANSYLPSFTVWVLILPSLTLVEELLRFAGGKISKDLGDGDITHIVISVGDLTRLRAIRESIQWYFYPAGHMFYL